MQLRTLLFIPASDERKLQKVSSLTCDAIIFDLEDGVAPESKTSARENLKIWLPQVQKNILRVVRINSFREMLTLDLKSCVGPYLDAVMLPKLESEESLLQLDSILQAMEEELSLPLFSIKVIGLIESAKGIVACEAIAKAIPERLLTLCVGPADLAADLNLPPSSGPSALLYARSRIVIAAAAAGLQSAIDGPYPKIEELEGLRSDSIDSRALGFQGRLVLHPKHLGIIESCYSDFHDDEIIFAKEVVEAFHQNQKLGIGAFQLGDLVIDEPVYQRYLRILEMNSSSLSAKSTIAEVN